MIHVLEAVLLADWLLRGVILLVGSVATAFLTRVGMRLRGDLVLGTIRELDDFV